MNMSLTDFAAWTGVRTLFFHNLANFEYLTLITSRGEWIVFWWPNMNTKIIQFPKNDRIRLLFGFPIMTEYKYHLDCPKLSNTTYKYKFCWASQKEGLQVLSLTRLCKILSTKEGWSYPGFSKEHLIKEIFDPFERLKSEN